MPSAATPWELAEQALLRAVLRQPALLGQVMLRPDQFSRDSHAVIWRCAQQLHREGRPVVPQTVHLLLSEFLQDQPTERDNAVAYVDRLHAKPVDTSTELALDNAREVRKWARVRLARAELDGLQRLAAAHDPRVLEGIADLQARLVGEADPGEIRTWGSVVRQALDEIEAEWEGRGPQPIMTGFPDLDRLRLFQPGDYIIVGARTSVGKSAWALRVATAAAAAGHVVLYVSMEMRDVLLAKRVLSADSQVPATRLRTGNLDEADWNALAVSAAKQDAWPIFVMDRGRRDLDTVQARARRHKATTGLSLVIVDYIQRLHMTVPGGRARREIIAEYSSAFKDLAGELACPVVCLAQLNREGDSPDGRRPTLANLRDSGDLEQDADTVVLMSPELGKSTYNQWRELDCRPVLFDVAKGRDGETMDVHLLFIKQRVLFVQAAVGGRA